MFWIEHLIILVAPIFCIATHRFQLLPRGWSMTMTAFLALAAYRKTWWMRPNFPLVLYHTRFDRLSGAGTDRYCMWS